MTNPAESLEHKEPPAAPAYLLRLYIAGSTVRSSRAIANIKAICEEHLKDRYELTVIDLFQQPEQARKGQVIAAPTLVKEMPLPVRRLIGELTNTERAILALGIEPATTVP